MTSNGERWLSKATGALFAPLPDVPPTPLATSTPKKSGRIREKWLRYTPAMISKIMDCEELLTLSCWYLPSEQGRTVEEQAYIEEMYACINERLKYLESLYNSDNATIIVISSDNSTIDISSDSVECLN